MAHFEVLLFNSGLFLPLQEFNTPQFPCGNMPSSMHKDEQELDYGTPGYRSPENEEGFHPGPAPNPEFDGYGGPMYEFQAHRESQPEEPRPPYGYPPGPGPAPEAAAYGYGYASSREPQDDGFAAFNGFPECGTPAAGPCFGYRGPRDEALQTPHSFMVCQQ